MFREPVLWAFSLTLLAGLATGVGSAAAFFARRTNTRLLAVALGFSAGVMIYVSFVEIFVKARDALIADLGLQAGSWATIAAFFGGMLFIGLIDKFVPAYENPHEMHRIEELRHPAGEIDPRLLRMGVFSALAIAIHNIPEGITVSIPVYYATGSRGQAFLLSFLSGFSEPVGAIVGYLLLFPFMTDMLFGLIFAGVAGIMVFISFDGLLPAAHEYGKHHFAIYGLVAGMAVMAVSLVMFV